MNEKEFNERMEKETGMKLGKDFGFVIGTVSPFKKEGLQSADRIEGFYVWRRGGEMLNVVSEHTFEELVDFIKNGNPGRHRYGAPQGEYSPDVTELPKDLPE